MTLLLLSENAPKMVELSKSIEFDRCVARFLATKTFRGVVI